MMAKSKRLMVIDVGGHINSWEFLYIPGGNGSSCNHFAKQIDVTF